MSASTDRPTPSRTWLLALLLGLVIFGGRNALVFFVGSPVPFHDQWIVEADQLIVPASQHAVNWRNFVEPNGDHLTIPTRLIAYGLYRFTGRWDTIAEMLVNNAIIAAAFALLLHFGLRWSSSRLTAAATLIVASWLASPLFYGNAIWGFQSSIELLVLAGVIQILATATMKSIDGRWWLASTAAIVGAVSFGSGFFASAIAGLICLVRVRELSRPAFWSSLVVNALVLLGGLDLILRSPSLGASHPQLGNILHSAAHALSWPAMQPSDFAFLLWLPTLVAAVRLVRERTPLLLTAFALSVWTLFQIASIAITRSEPVPALAPRYYDIFAVGVIANALLCVAFISSTSGRTALRGAAIALIVVWIGGVGFRAAQFTRSHVIYDVPTLGQFAHGQIVLVSGYYAGGGAATLTAAQFPVRPYPEVAYLDRLLAHPAIRAALPNFLTSGPPHPEWSLLDYPWPGAGPKRATWFQLSMSLYGLAFFGYLWGAVLRPRVVAAS